MAKSTEELAHHEWIGYVQPVGLVVSVPAMLEAQCYVNKNISGDHARFLNCLPRDQHDEIVPEIADFRAFTSRCLCWQEADLKEVPRGVTLSAEMATLEVILPQYQESLRPTHVVPAFKHAEGEPPWQMLVQVLPTDAELDDTSSADSSRHWNAAPQLKFERLLRETQTPIGILCNGKQLRLVYAPRGESSGHATFNVAEMVQVSGRPMFAALHMLLSAERMFSLPDNQRLPAILENSRKYQSTVSTKLAEQVLAALYELMRGFQAANDVRQGELLREVLAGDPNHVYSGLLTVLMRLVFVLYAEDRNLMSSDPVYSNNYSLTGLFERLREDRGRFPDTMDQRFGAWSQLLTLFRLVFEGGQHGSFQLPARKGYLFDPDRYPFLEGRSRIRDESKPTTTPRISDGVVYRVLRNLLILDGERLSYRSLDVEQIGSVYETVMGFNLQVAEGKSIAIKPAKSHGAPTTINLDALLATMGKDRAKWLNDHADQKLGTADSKLLKEAASIEEILTALDKKIQKEVTPRVVPAGAIILQPSDERRRSGSHYTPRSLTEPIVRTTLEPILKQLCDPHAELPAAYKPSREDKQRYTNGELEARIRQSERAVDYAKQAKAVGTPHPSQILDLKICDPAMGSGAFLVEACRQLGDQLVRGWAAHRSTPADIPPDEDEVLYARRLIAQRCLYGVDKNHMAVDLAKLSVWLVTLAKDHPFTFLDHSLRYGDSLVGLTRSQIIGFHWEPKKQKAFGEDLIQKRLDRATEARAKILNAREDVPYKDQEQRLALAEEALAVVRVTGDACLSAFFSRPNKKQREDRCEELFDRVRDWYASGNKLDPSGSILAAAENLNVDGLGIRPFHWEIEFPEVFTRADGGFDAFVGNPPFIGGPQLSHSLGGPIYQEWLKATNEKAFGNADLSAYFLRRAFAMLRTLGTFGLLATNSISEGSTRVTGLQAIIADGGVIYNAKRSMKWPGEAAVSVAVVHVIRQALSNLCQPILDDQPVPQVNSRLHSSKEAPDPVVLQENGLRAFMGAGLGSSGFVIDAEEHSELSGRKNNSDCLMPYLGGDEVNRTPTQSHERFAINFRAMPLENAEKYPELLEIVRARVKPDRDRAKDHGPGKHGKKYWWQFTLRADPLYENIASLSRCLVAAITTSHLSFYFVPIRQAFAHTVAVFAFDTYAPFAVLQSRVHTLWAHLFSSSLEDRLRYSVSDAFQTFPFPEGFQECQILEAAGNSYYQFRANLLVNNNEGSTKTYNRFHDPFEKSPDIQRLRDLHAAMDIAVLRAYGWNDLAEFAHCDFFEDREASLSNDAAGARRTKGLHRLRWANDFRSEVLGRLLELNNRRHNKEALAGRLAEGSKVVGRRATTKQVTTSGTTKSSRRSPARTRSLLPLEVEHIHLLMLFRQWSGLSVSRRVLNAGMILLLDDELRAALLNNRNTIASQQASNLTINQIFTDLSIDGLIEQVGSEYQQLWRITAKAPQSSDLSPEDLRRLEEVMEFLHRERAAGKVTVSEDTVDANVDLIPS